MDILMVTLIVVVAFSLFQGGRMGYCLKMDRTTQFNKALMDIKSKIDQSPNALEDIKFCCGNIDGFSASDLENIHSMRHLYKKLQELDKLREDYTEFLKDLLQSVNQAACVIILERYEESQSQPQQQPHSQPMHNDLTQDSTAVLRPSHGHIMQPTPSEDLSEAFEIIVDNIGRDWRRLARKLPGKKLSETDIEVLTDRHRFDLREQSRGALVLWQSKNSQLATKSTLIDVLRVCEMNYTADMLDGWQLR